MNNIPTIGFSIITIVYNDILHIKDTMNSIVNQSHKNVEYILVDGRSSDGTTEMILEYLSSCTNITEEEKDEKRHYLQATHTIYPSFTFKFLSERDKGIYDAMNKGIALATKKWINFMNCGDRFYNLEILYKISNNQIDGYDVVYGDTEFRTKIKANIIRAKRVNLYQMFFCHQSSFIKTEIMKEFRFNCAFKICADHNLFSSLLYNNYKFFYIPLTISSYDYMGVSSSLSWRMFYENCKIGYCYNKFFPLYLGLKYLLITIPKKILLTIISK